MKTTVSVIVRVLWWVVMLVGGAAFSIYLDFKDKNLFFSWWFHILTFIPGFFLSKLSFNAASVGGRELKKGRSEGTPRLETDTIVTTGIYSCMRHPMLFGLALLPIGWALILGSPHFIFYIAPIESLSVIIMVFTFEERECLKKFDGDYIEYKSKVPPLSFKRECLMWLFFKKKPENF